MPRLIFKCPHIKGGTKRAAVHLNHLVRYVATREGVQQITHRKNYTGYIAQRLGSHGLFTDTDKPLALSRVMDEVSKHPGTVWLPIISLRREDAARLGYDNAESWQALLKACAPELAQTMKIPPSQFRWYAAFHDKDNHPHVHMVCYSADGKSGFLTERGIEQIKSRLVKIIFQQDLTELYQRQTQRRDELTRESAEAMKRLAAEMQTGTLEDPHLQQLMCDLAERLKSVKGKKQYGYLPLTLKSLVDEIVDELAQDPRIAAAYDLWYQLREEVLRTYKDDLPPHLPLSQQKEFKRIRNLVVQEAAQLDNYLLAPEDNDEPVTDSVERLTERAKAGESYAQYALGKLYRDGGAVEKDSLQAVIWFTQAAEQGNEYAQFALGKMFLEAGALDKAAQWFRQAAEQGNGRAQYFLERMDKTPSLLASATSLLRHVGDMFQEQALPPARGVSFVDSKLRRRIREKKIAMGHKPDDHEEQTLQ